MDIVLRKWLEDNGANLGSIHFAETPFPQMPDLLKGGQIDAVAAIDPFRSRIVDAGVGYKVADYFSEVKDNVILAFWVASGGWARQNPTAVAGFRAALAESLDWIGAHPDEAHALEAKYLGVASPCLRHLFAGATTGGSAVLRGSRQGAGLDPRRDRCCKADRQVSLKVSR
jgi:NitT/TauT family transport system substrate-binding protein